MVPFLAISSLRPGSALWEKGEKVGFGEKKIGERMGKGPPPFPPPHDTTQLTSLADIFSI